MVSAVVMVAAAALCLWCAMRSSGMGSTVSAGVMFVAMVDHAWVHLIPNATWAAVVTVTGLLLGASLRPKPPKPRVGVGASRPDDSPNLREPTTRAFARASMSSLRRAHAIVCAISYPVMAMLLLVHSQTGSGSDGGVRGSGGASLSVAVGHHHGGSQGVNGFLVNGVVVAVAVALAVMSVLCARRQQRVLATEAGGMSAMLLAML